MLHRTIGTVFPYLYALVLGCCSRPYVCKTLVILAAAPVPAVEAVEQARLRYVSWLYSVKGC